MRHVRSQRAKEVTEFIGHDNQGSETFRIRAKTTLKLHPNGSYSVYEDGEKAFEASSDLGFEMSLSLRKARFAGIPPRAIERITQ